MATAQQGSDVDVQQLEPQAVVSVRATAPVADLGAAMDERLQTLQEYLRQRGARPAGPPFVRYHTFGPTETDFELGVPVEAPLPGDGRVTAGSLPSGAAVTTWHIGAHDTLRDAYDRLTAWLNAQGHTPDGASWEVYHWLDLDGYDGPATFPDAAGWRTELVQPITEPRSG